MVQKYQVLSGTEDTKTSEYAFRDLIVWQLAVTGHIRSRNPSPEKLKDFCDNLGVTVDVYQEAKLLYLALKESSKKNDHRLHIIKRQLQPHYQLRIDRISRETLDRYNEFINSRGCSAATWLRSMVHHYLLGSWEPPESVMVDEEKKIGRGNHRKVRGNVSIAAKAAIDARAISLGINTRVLLKTLMEYAIAGKWAQPGTISFVSTAQMHQDISKYYLPSCYDKVLNFK